MFSKFGAELVRTNFLDFLSHLCVLSSFLDLRSRKAASVSPVGRFLHGIVTMPWSCVDSVAAASNSVDLFAFHGTHTNTLGAASLVVCSVHLLFFCFCSMNLSVHF
jgi:hypothetical protein